MFKCLIVDDDPGKTSRIQQLIENELGAQSVHIRSASSAYDATQELRKISYDLMVIDLNLPARADLAAVRDGGVKLLQQVVRGANGLIRPLSIIGVTAFEDYAKDQMDDFHRHGWGMVTYSADTTEWEEAIINQCVHLTSCKERISSELFSENADVLILTALHKTELEAVLDLPIEFETRVSPADGFRYSFGEIVSGDTELSIVACAAPEMGNAATAALSMNTLLKFKPKVAFLCGVCAGIDAEVGDIVIAETALHYESGKWTEREGGETVFQPAPSYKKASGSALDSINRYILEEKAKILSLPSDWKANTPGRNVNVHIGPVASGAAVIENKNIIEDLKFRDRKLVGLEMESYGFYLSADMLPGNSMNYIMVKGVSDKATPPKGDDYKAYAAFLSARMVYNYIIHEASISGGLFA